MTTALRQSIGNRARMTPADMEKVSRLVYANSGIALRPETKEALVVARLQKRLRTLSFTTFSDYLRYVETDRSGNELKTMLDSLTTNHTSFFREPEHFEFLTNHVLPPLLGKDQSQPILGWTAACATGEEAYSIAVTLLDHIPPPQHSRLHLLASDLSNVAVATAQQGVYQIDRVSRIPQPILRRYFERGVGQQTGTARVKHALHQFVTFRRLNLMEIDQIGQRFQFIFCRNAMIYFDGPARQRVVTMAAKHLVPKGFLFLSQCESLGELTHSFKWCAAGIYQLR
jgi:chemotaxis protein methyltransferase CheR